MTHSRVTAYQPGCVTFDFTDQVVVVTGASGGVGAAVAEQFAASGADVLLHGRNTERLAAGVARVEAHGRKAVTVSGNIRSPETAANIVDVATDTFGRIDMLINNAGGNFASRIEDLSANAWNATLEANLTGAFHLSTACLPVFRQQGGGVVVNIGSASASYAHPLRGAYAVAKAGLASLTRTLAWEWAADNIRVNCLEPGPVKTPASRFTDAETERAVAQFVALNRLGEPDDIASVVQFLCSAGAAYMTGETVIVSGGPLTATPADSALIRTATASTAHTPPGRIRPDTSGTS